MMESLLIYFLMFILNSLIIVSCINLRLSILESSTLHDKVSFLNIWSNVFKLEKSFRESISLHNFCFNVSRGSSDIHLEENSPIAVRVNSDIKVSPQKLESEDMDQLLFELLGEEKLNEFTGGEIEEICTDPDIELAQGERCQYAINNLQNN